MSKKLILLLSGVFFFFIFIGFSYLVHKDLFTQIDFNTTVRLQDNISRRFDNIFSIFSEVGKFEIVTICLVVIFAIARKFISGFIAFVLYVGFHLIELYGKFFVEHNPPPEFMLRTMHLMNFPQFHVRAENSYPSGHAGRALFLSIILITLILENRRLNQAAKIVLIAIIVGYDIVMLVSRVYLGEHWTTDVIGGAILGAALGLMSGGAIISPPKAVKI